MRSWWLFVLFFLSTTNLWSQGLVKVLLQDGHAGNINTLRVSHNDKYLLTGSEDNSVIIWDVKTGKQLTKIDEHRNEIFRVRFDDSAKHVISLDGGYDIIGDQVNRLIVTEAGSWKRLMVIDSISDKPDVFSHADHFFLIYQSGPQGEMTIDSVRVFSLTKYAHILTTDSTGFRLFLERSGYKEKSSDYELSAEGRSITVQHKGQAKVLLETGSDSCKNGLQPPFSSYYKDYHVSGDESRIALADYCNRIYIVDLRTGKLIVTLQLENFDRIQFNSAGDHLFVTHGPTTRLINIGTKESIQEYKGLLRPVGSMAVKPGSKHLLAFSQDSVMKKINLARPGSLRSFTGHHGFITTMAFSADGKQLATGATDPSVFIWDTEKNEKTKSIDPSKLKVMASDMFASGPEYYVPKNLKFISNDYDNFLFTTLHSKAFLWTLNKGTYNQFPIEEGFFEIGQNILLTKSGSDSAQMLLQQEQVQITFPPPHIFRNSGKTEYPKLLAAATDSAARLVVLGGMNSVDIWTYNLEGKKEKLQTIPGCTRPVRWLRLSTGGQRLLVSCFDNSFRIYQKAGSRFNLVLDTILSPVTAVQFLDDGQEFVTAHQKGYITAWDIAGRPSHTAYFFADGNYILRIPGNYYMSSRSSLKGMSFEVNSRIFSPDQFDHIYNRPDKVLEYLGEPDTALITSFRNAYLKRLKRLKINIEAGIDLFNGPVAGILNADSIHYQQYSPDLELHTLFTDTVSGLQKINIWINEVPLYGSTGLAVTSNPHQLDTIIHITLGKGKNWIEVSAINQAGVESLRLPLFVNNGQASQSTPRLHFIGIGINQYRQKGHELSWSVKDIRDLAKKLKERYGDRILIDTLFDKDVSVKNITAMRKKLVGGSVDDIVILAYSGHGLLSKEFDYYLSTYQVDFDNPTDGGLAYDQLEAVMDGIPSRQKLMLIDACHSGEVDKEEMEKYEWFEKNAGDSTARSSRKPVPKEGNLGMQNSFELMQELFMNVSRSTGTTVISAAAGTQFAQENSKLQNGVFTFAILEYMDQHPQATVSELRDYVNKRVTELTKGLQVPTARSGTRLVDWRVW